MAKPGKEKELYAKLDRLQSVGGEFNRLVDELRMLLIELFEPEEIDITKELQFVMSLIRVGLGNSGKISIKKAATMAGHDLSENVRMYYGRPPTMQGPMRLSTRTLGDDLLASPGGRWFKHWFRLVYEQYLEPMHEKREHAPQDLKTEYAALDLDSPNQWERLKVLMQLWQINSL